MKNRKIFQFITCMMLVFSMMLTSCMVAFSAEDIPEGEEIDLLLDFSTYGAVDQFETAAATYLGAAGFTDVEDETLLQALGLLSYLDIMQGNGDGQFLPENNITRAEFVTTVLRMMNVDAASVSGTDKKFYDVASDNIFYHEIYAACNLSIITGFQDNTFRPEETISTGDALVILVRTLGYGVPAEEDGGYPSGYTYQAQRIGITDGLSLDYLLPLKRSQAAMLLYQCLETKVMETVAFGEPYSYEATEPALYHFFGIDFDYGIVEATELSAMDGRGAADEGRVRIDGMTYLCDITSLHNYLGYEVKFYFQAEHDVNRVVYLEKTENNKEITIKASDIISYDDYTLTYYENDKTRSVTIPIKHNLLINGVQPESYTKDVFTPDNGYLKLISANTTGGFNTIFVNTFYNLYVESLSIDGTTLTVVPAFDAQALSFDMDKVTVELYDQNGMLDMTTSVRDSFDADGNPIKVYSLPPIPTNALISVFTDDMKYDGKHYFVGNDATYIKIYINSLYAEGKADAVVNDSAGKPRKLTVGKLTLDVSNDNYFDHTDGKLNIGTEGKFWLDFDGRAAVVAPSDAVEGTFQYGYLITARTAGDFTKSLSLKLMNSQGKFVTYEVEKLKLNGAVEKDMGKALTTLQNSAKLLDPTFTISQPIRFKLDADNKMTDLQTVTASVGVAAGFDKAEQFNRESERTTYSYNYYFSETLYADQSRLVVDLNTEGNPSVTESKSTLLYGRPALKFVVPETETFDEKDYALLTVWDDDDGKYGEIYDCDDNLMGQLFVAYEEQSVRFLEQPFMVVDSVGSVLDEEGMTVSAVFGANGKSEVTYYGEETDTFAGVVKGDILALKGNDDVVTDFIKIHNVYDIANLDYDAANTPETRYLNRDGTKFYFTAYEVYSENSRVVTLQSGDRTGNKQRKYRRVTYWSENQNVLQFGGCVVTINANNGNLSMKAGGPTDIIDAASYGHEASSKMLVCEAIGHSPKGVILVTVK